MDWNDLKFFLALVQGKSLSAAAQTLGVSPSTVSRRIEALEQALHSALVNRGCLIAPFHNMMLVSPATTDAQIDRLVAAFDAITAEMMA